MRPARVRGAALCAVGPTDSDTPARSRARLQALLSSLDDLVFELDENGVYQSIWTANDDLLVIPREALLGMTPRQALGDEVGGAMARAVARVIRTGRSELLEYCLKVQAGTRWFEGRITPVPRSASRPSVCLLVRDITAQKLAERARDDAERRLRHQALFDGLTELPNRTLFRERVNRALKLARRKEIPLVVLMLDLDRFKEINDTLGHAAGDLLLQEVARRLATVTRGSDSIARLGGDEFAVLLQNATDEDGQAIADRIAVSLEESITIDHLPLNIDISVGLAAFPRDGADADTLLQRADVAMYFAKGTHSGFARYDRSIDPHTPERLALVGELHEALEREEFVLHFQPQLDLVSGDVVAVEALLRWQHPERGLIPPDDFIPLVKDSALIKPLTHYVIDHALAQCRAWIDVGRHLRVAVNLTMRNLIDADFPWDVEKLLRKHQVSPDMLELEITETSILADPRRTEAALRQLAKMGIRLSIDDFGTGYSFLTHVTWLPVDEVKIDRSFVTDLSNSPDDLAVVRSTIQLARSLGKEVVAEGVETEEVLLELEQLGCHLAQGYHVSRPLPIAALDEWLATKATRKPAVTPPGRSGRARKAS